MLSEQGYIEGLGYMLAWYVNFQFRLYDVKKDKYGNENESSRVPSMQYKVWYEAFKEFSDEDFGSVVKGYCNSEIYPPSSPASILTYAKTRILQEKEGEIESAWQDFIRFIDVYGFRAYRNSDMLIINPLEKQLKKHSNQLIRLAYEQNKSSFQEINDDNRDWKRKEFFEYYRRLLTNEVNINVLKGKIGLTSSNDKKQLKEKE